MNYTKTTVVAHTYDLAGRPLESTTVETFIELDNEAAKQTLEADTPTPS